MRPELQKSFFLISVILFIFSVWEFSFMWYWKILSVVLHESFHALFGMLLGGRNILISVGVEESGTTIIHGLHSSFIPLVASSGYLGTIIVGSYLVNKSFQYRISQFIAFIAGNWFIFIVLFFLEPFTLIYSLTLYTGICFILLSFFGRFYSSIGMVFLGLTLVLYGVYDIYDIYVSPAGTDAGIIAHWILENFKWKSELRTLSLRIGLSYYVLGVAIIIYSNRFLLFGENSGEKGIDKMTDLVSRGHVTKEVADWFLEKGKDLDGMPLSKKNIQYLRETKDEK